jgi:hypothetical protein
MPAIHIIAHEEKGIVSERAAVRGGVEKLKKIVELPLDVSTEYNRR